MVDGGSRDNTVEIAREYEVSVLTGSGKGRARQMNYGAEHAAGDLLYFLHADTYPPENFMAEILDAFDKGYRCGCFRLSFDNPHWALTTYSWFTRFDVDVFRFGDQSLFVETSLFEQINGYKEQLLVMEDQVIVKNLKKEAEFVILEESVLTSARKYEEIGVFRLQFIFTIIVLLYYTGVSQEVLADFYKKALKSQ